LRFYDRLFGQPEVGDLDFVVEGEENVLGFDVSVDNF
jgi:hypothetical protein